MLKKLTFLLVVMVMAVGLVAAVSGCFNLTVEKDAVNANGKTYGWSSGSSEKSDDDNEDQKIDDDDDDDD